MSAAKESKFPHPEWHGPFGDSNLKVFNSLTGKLNNFVPKEGNQVTWYTCGPTVYDSAHLGHARAYVTFDIVRRILQDYFNYDVYMVMNITDIDDKIILRARRNYLLAQYREQAHAVTKIKEDIKDAFGASISKQTAKVEELQSQESTVEDAFKDDLLVNIKEEQMKLDQLKDREEKFDALDSSTSAEDLINTGSDVLAAKLDKELASTVTDHSIFKAHTAKYETEFLGDMRALGVRDADVLTRVSEYVPQIIDFVQTIIDKGIAYESKGSVYFSVDEFRKSHDYGKLAPSKVGNSRLTADAEGSLATGGSEKRSPNDFALWKASKVGEPSWDSPWGKGRPGWHIECSAMASDILGENFDVHSGGEDLKFPHHDNELAQSEACSGNQQWVNHFWHAGHLNIQGLKMSKSLKNFITIGAVLERYSPQQIRVLFTMQGWDKKMDYSDAALTEAQTKLSKLKSFFLNVQTAIRGHAGVRDTSQLWLAADRKLDGILRQTEADVYTALCNNFDYPSAFRSLLALIAATNTYLADNAAAIMPLLLERIMWYVDKMLRTFGIIPDNSVGFVQNERGNSEETMGKFFDAFTAFRDQIRAVAKESKNVDILQLCDQVRDTIFPALGLTIEDKGEASIWKLTDPEEWAADQKRQAANKIRKQAAKIENKITTANGEAQKIRIAIMSDADYFKSLDQYKGYTFGDDGLPSLDQEGKELKKSGKKAISKLTTKRAQSVKKLTKKYGAPETWQAALDEIEASIEGYKKDLQDLLNQAE